MIYFKQLCLPSCRTRSCDAIKYDAKIKPGILVLAHAVTLQAQILGKACLYLHEICHKTYIIMEV